MRMALSESFMVASQPGSMAYPACSRILDLPFLEAIGIFYLPIKLFSGHCGLPPWWPKFLSSLVLLLATIAPYLINASGPDVVLGAADQLPKTCAYVIMCVTLTF